MPEPADAFSECNRYDRGILLAASGDKCNSEALCVRESIVRHCTGVPVALYTDRPDTMKGRFDSVYPIADTGRLGHKIYPLINTPFEQTVFLDTDTLVIEPIDELFELLKRFDIAAAHEPHRWPWGDNSLASDTCPRSFPEFNTGVIAFRQSPEVTTCFWRWAELYETQLHGGTGMLVDQPAFQRAMYESNAAIYVLPPEYNVRTNHNGAVGAMKAKILHGRVDLQRLADRINRSSEARALIRYSSEVSTDNVVCMHGEIRLVKAIAYVWAGLRAFVARISGRVGLGK